MLACGGPASTCTADPAERTERATAAALPRGGDEVEPEPADVINRRMQRGDRRLLEETDAEGVQRIVVTVLDATMERAGGEASADGPEEAGVDDARPGLLLPAEAQARSSYRRKHPACSARELLVESSRMN